MTAVTVPAFVALHGLPSPAQALIWFNQSTTTAAAGFYRRRDLSHVVTFPKSADDSIIQRSTTSAPPSETFAAAAAPGPSYAELRDPSLAVLYPNPDPNNNDRINGNWRETGAEYGYGTADNPSSRELVEMPTAVYGSSSDPTEVEYWLVAFQTERGDPDDINDDVAYAVAAKPLAVGDEVWDWAAEGAPTYSIFVYETGQAPQTLTHLPQTIPGPGTGGPGTGGPGTGGPGTGGPGTGGPGPGTVPPYDYEWEKRWEAFTGSISAIPFLNNGVSVVSVFVDGYQFGTALLNGDADDLADELGDITGSFIGVIPVVGPLIGDAIGDAITAGIHELFDF